jgi:hypothetical protein
MATTARLGKRQQRRDGGVGPEAALKLHVEAAKMAPRLSPELALLYDQAKAKGNATRATLAVARQAGGVLDGYRSPPEEFPCCGEGD